MSMRTLLSEVRTALTSHTGLTDLIPEEKITLARRPQQDTMPGIVFTIGTVDYDPTTQSFAAATTYRIDTTVFGVSADQVTEIHDEIKLALASVQSSVFSVRISDERYMVDVDNNHMAEVQSMWMLDSGLSRDSATFISPSWQGYDHMDINYNFKITDGSTTTVSLTEQVYYLDYKTSGSQATHSVQLPEARQNLGKIYTFLLGTNIDNNSVVELLPYSGESVETSQSYDLNRAHSAVNIVAVQTSTGASPTYGWRVWSYHGLHD